MLDLEKPIVTSDGRHAVLVSQDVPGDKQFLVAFENEVTGELTSGTFNRVQLQEQFRNEVVPETFIYEIVLGPEGVPLLVSVNGQDDVMEGSHCVAVTILGEQATEVSLLDGTGKPEGWAMIEGGQEDQATSGFVMTDESFEGAKPEDRDELEAAKIDVIVQAWHRAPTEVKQDDVW